MTRDNIYAHTDPTPGYPGYVSLNREEDGSVSLTVRSPGNNGLSVGTINLTDAQLKALSDAIRLEALGESGAGG